MYYEDLILKENFSEDEITFEYKGQEIKDKEEKESLRKLKKLQNCIAEFKAVS